jgi:hypothetical protein
MSALLDVFFSPGKAFDQVRERSLWIPAVVAVMLISIATFAVVANLVGMETLVRKQLETSSRAASLTAEQKDAAISQASSPVRLYLGYGAAAIGSVVTLLLIAGISLGAVAAAGGKVKYAQALGAVSYSAVPFSLLSLVMTTAVILATPDRENLNFNNLIATNVGAFLNPESTGKAIYSIASSLDVISFAHIALLGYALSKVSRLSFSTCVLLVAGMWTLYVLAKAGVSTVF